MLPSIFVERSTVMPGSGGGAWNAPLAALHILAFVLLLLMVMAWARHPGRRRLAISAVASVLAVVAAYLATVHATDLPIEWLTIMHHGLERKSIMHLYGRGVHAGAAFAFLSTVAAGGAVPHLRDVVWMNLLLALVNALVFLHIAIRVCGRPWGIVWTLVFALNAATFQASFSELPTNAIALYFLAALIAWAVATDDQPQPGWVRAAAYVLCLFMTLLVGLVRLEVALIGVVALLLRAGDVLLGPDWWPALGRRLLEACKPPLRFLARHPAVVVAFCVLGWWLSIAGIPGLLSRSEVSGLYPFNPSILALYFFLPSLLLPIGVSVATLFGSLEAVVNFRLFGGLALSLLILVRMYFGAQYQFYEMGRYLSYLLPPLFVLGLYGKASFDRLVVRWCTPNWARAAQVAYLMAWFTLPIPGVPEYYTRPEYRRELGFSQLLLDLNVQQEVRHLVALTEHNPECVFIARVIDDHGDPKAGTRYDYFVFGTPMDEPLLVPEADMRLEEVVAKYTAGATCVRLYFGGDCNLNFSDGCKQFIAGRQQVDEVRFWSRPYNNPIQSGYAAPEVVLATYAWP